MHSLPKKLKSKLDERQNKNALRQLGAHNHLVDFSSNDYLGFAKSETIFNKSHEFLIGHHILQNGVTGSRLLSGNHSLFHIIENMLTSFHKSESALIFNSGYDANVGFFSSVPQRGDMILYDEYSHASIRDGILMSQAKAYKFNHNDLEDLARKCQKERRRSPQESVIYVVTESIFSMDGDSPDLRAMSKICNTHSAHLVVDEAHAIGVFGERGAGLIQYLNLETDIFARIMTFGKAIGCHGAAILGSHELKKYLVNFSRSFIYTTALTPHSLATIHTAYNELLSTQSRDILQQNILFFKSEIQKNNIQNHFIESDSAIQSCIIPGNEHVKSIALELQKQGFNVRPILSPTVPKHYERLRFCLHAYNSKEEISKILSGLATCINI